MGDRSAQLKLSATGRGDDAVVVDGQNLSNAVRRVLLTAEAGEPPTLVLELAARAFVVDAEGARVGVSPVGEHILAQLGWTPPGPDLTRVRMLAEALHRIDQTHLRHDNPHGQYHGYGEALLAALDGREPEHADQFTVPALADDPEVGALLGQQDRVISLLAELTAEVLATFYEKGHPGRPCQRTGWVAETTLARWRERLAELSTVQPPG